MDPGGGNAPSESAHGFTTKLSLRKFISVAKSLNPTQQELVRSIGCHHLLNLSCDTLPKSLVLWLVKYFDPTSRTFSFPNGFSFTVSSYHIHQILGIPLGGRSVPSICDVAERDLIATETGCIGNYPTINELKNLIKDSLIGDTFKRVFMLFALSAFLCPSSHDCASPEYYKAVRKPDEIALYDWSGAVLDKLVSSIYTFRQSENSGGVTALGGCVFALVILYFEFIDTGDFNFPNRCPRIQFWSTEVIRKYVSLDALTDECHNFGRLPMRHVSRTPFRRVNLTSARPFVMPLELEATLLSLFLEEEHNHVRSELQQIYEDLCNGYVTAVEPVINTHMKKVAEMMRFKYEVNASSIKGSAALPGSPFGHKKAVEHGSNLSVSRPSAQIDATRHCAVVPTDNAGQKKTDIKPFPVFLCPDIIDPPDCMTNFSELFDSCLHSLPTMKISPGFDMLSLSEAIINEMKKYIHSVAQPVLDDTSIPAADLFQLSVVGAIENDIHGLSMAFEKHVSFSELLSTDIKQSSEELANEIVVPYKKRPLSFKEELCDASAICAISPTSNQADIKVSGMTRAFPMSLNERLQYTLEARKKKLKFQKQGNSSSHSLVGNQKPNLLHSSKPCSGQLGKDVVAQNIQCIEQESSPPLPFEAANHKWGEEVSEQHCANNDNLVSDSPSQFVALYNDWDEDTMKELGESMDIIENLFSPGLQNQPGGSSKSDSHDSTNGLSYATNIPLNPKIFYHIFTSTPVEQAIYQYIVQNIPAQFGRSPHVVEINKSQWVDHRTFGLSMQVYGSVSEHVINIMGVAVMAEQYWDSKRGLLTPEFWSRHVVKCCTAALFQDPDMLPSKVSNFLTEPNQGYRLDVMNMIFLPLQCSGLWYLIVANFRHKRFEVMCPNEQVDIIKKDADTVIWNFQRAFSLSYPRSIRINVYEMQVALCSVSKSKKPNDSGVFVMQLIRCYTGNTHFHFKPEHAKIIRENLTYYLVANEHNDKKIPEIERIKAKFSV